MRRKFDLKIALAAAGAVLFTWLLHEFSHWLTGRLLGYEMIMTLNSTYPVDGVYVQDWHNTLISAIGPIVTVLEAVVVYILMRVKPNIYGYLFLFTCFYMRLVAGVLNIIHLNDEGRVGASLGIGVYTLPLIVSAILFGLVSHIARREHYSLRFNALIAVLVIFFSSIVILADQVMLIRLL